MAAPTIYRSTDASAPTLTGETGSLVNLLDLCLVVGYGAKAAAGWTKPYVGTSKASFRQGAGNQFYLRVQDDGPGTSTFKEARVVGYEVMTTVDAGTKLFPTAAQMATGLFVRKSFTADATARAWIVIADDRTFYLFISTGDVAATYYAFMFGDIFSLLTADGYRTLLIARNLENSALASYDKLDTVTSNIATAVAGNFIARAYTGTGDSVNSGRHADYTKGQSAYLLGGVPYPNPEDSGAYLSPIFVHDPTLPHVRGRMRGQYHLCHPVASFADGDTFTGAGAYAGKTFIVIKATPNGGLYCMETTAWDTSS